MSRTFMVCLDGSKNGNAAFDTAVQMMSKEEDKLVILAVAMQASITYFAGFHTAPAISQMREINQALVDQSKRLVQNYMNRARRNGVKNNQGVTGLSSNIGEFICRCADEYHANMIIMGRRGMSTVARFFIGSVSSYVTEHANCNVLVVRGEAGPEELHEISKTDARVAEEQERLSRMQENAARERSEEHDSCVARETARAAEENERHRRMAAERVQEWVQSAESARDKAETIAAEEKERARRIAVEDPRTHLPSSILGEIVLIKDYGLYDVLEDRAPRT